MIYYDRKPPQQHVNRLSKHLFPGGYLVIGHVGSFATIIHPFSMIQSGIRTLPKSWD